MNLYGLIINFFKKRNGMDPLKEENDLSSDQLDVVKENLKKEHNFYIQKVTDHFEKSLNLSAVIENLVLFTKFLNVSF